MCCGLTYCLACVEHTQLLHYGENNLLVPVREGGREGVVKEEGGEEGGRRGGRGGGEGEREVGKEGEE